MIYEKSLACNKIINTQNLFIMKKLAIILAMAFTMGLSASSLSAATKDKKAKATTECPAKKEKKECCKKEAKACCSEKKAEVKK